MRTAFRNARPRIDIAPVLTPEPVRRDAVGLSEGADLFRIALRLRPPWMAPGHSVELRFPEVLRSSAGIHLLDHYVSSLSPLADPDPLPTWHVDADDSWCYTCSLTDGVTFSARAAPREDTVELTFTVHNGTAQPLLAVEANMCLDLKQAPHFGQPGQVDNIFASFEGEMTSLSATSPSAHEMGRPPWLLILTKGRARSHEGSRDSPTWWCPDQLADRSLMAARSVDGRRTIGYAWEGMPPSLMCNGNNPCMHAGPQPADHIPPAASATFQGKVYFLDSPSLADLTARYDAHRYG